MEILKYLDLILFFPFVWAFAIFGLYLIAKTERSIILRIIVILATAITIIYSIAHVINILIPLAVQEEYHLYIETGGGKYFPPLK